jgi:hypothetical protein
MLCTTGCRLCNSSATTEWRQCCTRASTAAASVDNVIQIVNRVGWVMGGRGKLTAGMLRDMVIAKGEKVGAGEKVADLITQALQRLRWGPSIVDDCGSEDLFTGTRGHAIVHQ